MWRRRIAAIALGVGIALMARDSCAKRDRTRATIVLAFGAGEPSVKSVTTELWMNGDLVSTFHRQALGGHLGPTQFAGSLPGKDGELRIDVELVSGLHRAVVRSFHAEDDSTVTIPLETTASKAD